MTPTSRSSTWRPGKFCGRTNATWVGRTWRSTSVRTAASSSPAGGKREVNFLDAATGKLVVTTSALPDPALAARFSPDGGWVAVGGIGKPPGIRVFEPKTGKRLPTIDTELRRIGDFDFSRDGKLLAVASLFGLQVFDTASAKPVLTMSKFGKNVYGTAFSPDATRLAVTCDDGLVRIYPLKLSEAGAAPKPAPQPEPKPAELNARQTAKAFLEASVAGKAEEAQAHTDKNVSAEKAVELNRAGVERVDISLVAGGGHGGPDRQRAVDGE